MKPVKIVFLAISVLAFVAVMGAAYFTGRDVKISEALFVLFLLGLTKILDETDKA